MVIFHSYVSLPEGKQQRPTKTPLTRLGFQPRAHSSKLIYLGGSCLVTIPWILAPTNVNDVDIWVIHIASLMSEVIKVCKSYLLRHFSLMMFDVNFSWCIEMSKPNTCISVYTFIQRYMLYDGWVLCCSQSQPSFTHPQKSVQTLTPRHQLRNGTVHSRKCHTCNSTAGLVGAPIGPLDPWAIHTPYKDVYKVCDGYIKWYKYTFQTFLRDSIG